MKITKVEVFRLPTANSKQNSPIGCRVYTDTGLFGDGEAGMAYGIGGDAAFGMVVDLAQLVIGMNPLQTELIWETMYKKTFWGRTAVRLFFPELPPSMWHCGISKASILVFLYTSCLAAR